MGERIYNAGPDFKAIALTDDPLLVDRGWSSPSIVPADDILHLRKRISTDGILPTRGGRFFASEDLAAFALAGVPGVKEGDIKDGGYNTIIVGDGFGSGSAREHAPLALQGAGIKVVLVAGRAERIFRDNCFNLGGPRVYEVEPSVDSINEAVRQIREHGEESVPPPYPDPLRKSVFDQGGLLRFTQARIEGGVTLPIISHPELGKNHPMTAVEKILAMKMTNIDPTNRVVTPGDVGVVSVDIRFSYELHSLLIDAYLKQIGQQTGVIEIKEPQSVFMFEDHSVLDKTGRFYGAISAQREFAQKHNLRLYGNSDGVPGSEGICHTLVVERSLVLPGQTCIGSDSHTCQAGGLGAYAVGAGASQVACSMLTKDFIVEVPQTVKVEFVGRLRPGCTSKDVILKLLSDEFVLDGGCIDKAIEYGGEGINNWSLDELLVLTNMAVEAGATTGIIPEPTLAVINHLVRATGLSESEIRGMFVQSDKGAKFAHTISMDLGKIEPMVALPGNPKNGIPISSLPDMKITSAYIGSCTGGKLDDIRAAAEVLNGRVTSVPLFVQCASVSIYRQAELEGLIDIIVKAGGQVLPPGCGACIGLGPGKIMSPEDVVISDTNRNFDGRMGVPEVDGKAVEGGKVYLSSSSTVAASCIAGKICSAEDVIKNEKL